MTMKINFSDLLCKRVGRKKVEELFDLKDITFENEKIKCLAPVKVEGEVSSHEDILIVDLHVETILELKCSRCLENFSQNVSLDMCEKFTNNKIDEGDDENQFDEVTFVDSDILDIAEVVENNIISTLPIKRLCSEECKGLCHKCGTNYNLSKCQCDNEDIDERFAALKDFFTE